MGFECGTAYMERVGVMTKCALIYIIYIIISYNWKKIENKN